MNYSKETTLVLQKVVDGINLSAFETEQVFLDIFKNDKEGYHYLALCSALHAKGETVDELYGLCRATMKQSIRLRPNVPSEKLTDLAGTGGGKLKTINVSTLASFIVCAGGYAVAKQAFWGVTSPTGSADIFKAFGVDILSLKKRQVLEAIEDIGISPCFYPALSPKMRNRSKLSKKIFNQKGLHIRSPFSLAAFAYSPFPLKKRVYGCYSAQYLDKLGDLQVVRKEISLIF